ncbi:MAG: LacI family DNA-binding transcriptional regulator [Ectobacillus sp.]
MATIREVAKLAGVSVATVSRVLNKKGYVHEDTVKQVEQAIEKLQYKPNAVAKSLFKKSSTMIALLLSDFEQSSFPKLFSVIEQTAYEAGYQVVVCNIKDRAPYVDVLLQNNIAGILITQEAYRQLNGTTLTVPFVILDGERDMSRNYDYEGAKLATLHLLEKGCRFPAFIKGPDIPKLNERLEAFLDIVEESKIPHRIVESGLSVEAGEQAATELLKKAPYIDGIIACSDAIALGTIRAAQKIGISIPEHLQIIGFEGMPAGAFVYPSLTTVAEPEGEKAALATQLLIRQIQKKAEQQTIRPFPFAVVERESTR